MHHSLLNPFVALILLLTGSFVCQAQGIRGMVKASTGQPMSFATIAAKGTTLGTIANEEGRYELPLKPGQYEIVFQFLGYKAAIKQVTIATDYQTIDITMAEQSIQLQDVKIGKNTEDPAVSIMRRAIAKARFHQLQVQQFKARVYTKSSFIVHKLPMTFLYQDKLKELEKESNIKIGRPVLNENVAEVEFKLPNTVKQRIVASRNSQVDNQFVQVNAYYNANLYTPKLLGAVSPLAPNAFGYYRFEYEGTFHEQGVDVSKIKVIPRQYGDGVVRGTLYIIEDTWAIYSAQLETINEQGFTIKLKTTCSPIQSVWMPVSQQFDVDGSFMGATFSAQAVRSQTFRDFVVNPGFVEDVKVVDERFNAPARTLSKADVKAQPFAEAVAKQKEFSTKNLKQLVKEYEKAEYKARKSRKEDVAVVRNDSTVIDSLARKRSNAFWDSLRTVPLTKAEVVSYQKSDSLRVIKLGTAPTDSLKKAQAAAKKRKANSPINLLFGQQTWNPSRRTTWNWSGPLGPESGYFNTVEGFPITASLRFNRRLDSLKQNRMSLAGVARYQTGRQQFMGYGLATYTHKTTAVELSGGRFVSQLNENNPVEPVLNTLTTVLFERNLMKLYQKDYLKLSLVTQPNEGRFRLGGSLEYAERTELGNYKENIKPLINWEHFSYTPNRPTTSEVETAGFPVHQALTLNLNASLRLGELRYRIRNGKRIQLTNSEAPLVTFNYRKGIAGVGSSDTDYDFAQLTWRHSVETGIRSRLAYQLSAGSFLTSNAVYFPDFKHFQGNEFFLQLGDPVSAFRFLPYYQYSTRSRFAEAHVMMEYRQLLLTQVTLVRLLGFKENLFVHYLATPASRNYTEAGYGLDGLIPGFPFFRVEVVGRFQGGNYLGTGFLIGTTMKFGGN
ncbi:DUF5686 and carboxypeptidase regulatory-like domain-containing protein [Fibrella aquatilis]|uniref:Carboxypeptidase-like regulatory domain-containing protein n=1 Tax=Fibrella aquatilis TaxID=2817059 RepID=A0A939JU70_9BACT|nr:DUF5686 and carboxypeptidase regulatory-like domain-containing protein [Fibrella aquatilis]MBO0929482.1 carboxypeptidase-like regulatory domain-containing protein [Fibrella aquatilis]